MNKNLILILFSFLSVSLLAQRAIGEWQVYVPFSKSVSLTSGENKVFCASESGYFMVDLLDNSIEITTKEDGLSDVGISIIKYDNQTKTLVLGYDNGNIDLIQNKIVHNVPDLKRSFIQGDKKINNINFHDDVVYISTNFSILVVDILKREIRETYSLGNQGTYLSVFETAIRNDSIFAATAQGVKVGSLSNNLSDFQQWKDISPIKNVKYNTIVNFNNDVIVNYSKADAWDQDTLYVYKNNAWEKLQLPDLYKNNKIDNLDVGNNKLMISFPFNGMIVNSDYTLAENIYSYGDNFSGPQPIEMISIGKEYWIADKASGLIRRKNTFSHEVIAPKGPPFSDVYDIEFNDGVGWFASGSVTARWGNNYTIKGIYKFENREWTLYRNNGLDTIYDIFELSINPNNTDELFLGTWGKGLIRFEDGQMRDLYRDNNSTINRIDVFPFYAIGGTVFDDKGMLWVTNSGLPSNRILKPLSAFDGETWYNFRLSNFTDNIGYVNQIIVDQRGYKWIVSYRNGIIVFDENGTLTDDDDDRVALLGTNEGSGNLISNEIRAIAEDNDGNIWVGTSEGITVIRNPSQVFEPGGVDAERIIIEDGETFSYLLDGVQVSKIYVDGGNRKWIGTFGNGIYLISEDGKETIHHFTTENSPLLSDNILDIEINDNTGEVFIATEKGLVSYKGDAIHGSKYNGPLYAFPNPVPPNFEGEIGIKGLTDNAEVKITDITGNLVYETFANGGMASWDGKDLSGRKVQTGVYLVLASNTDGTSTDITKILFINGK
jgi:hypothetical protein